MLQKLIIAFFATILAVSASADAQDEYATYFKNADLKSCDEVFNKLDVNCKDMICQDDLTYEHAECWRRSMDAELNKRLFKLKNNNPAEFHAEMELQKTFNQAVLNQCNKNCGSGGTMRGIPYNFCRIAAYKYRTTQAIQINNNKLSIPVTRDLLPDKRNRVKQKDTKFYTAFAEKLSMFVIFRNLKRVAFIS